MSDRHRRVNDAGRRAKGFMDANIADFSAIPVVAEIVGRLTGALAEMDDLGAEKVTDTAAAKDATLGRGDNRMLLLDAMREISDDWKRMYKRLGDDPNKFRMPHGSDELNLSTGRSFHASATPLRGEFTKLGYSNDFLDQLQAKIDNFAASVNESENARRERVGTNASFDEPARTIAGAIDDLDPIVKRVYRNNPRKLAEWLSASHIERPRADDDNDETPPA